MYITHNNNKNTNTIYILNTQIPSIKRIMCYDHLYINILRIVLIINLLTHGSNYSHTHKKRL